jgi:hypothetical protein
MRATGSFGADEHQFREMGRMAGGIRRDHAAKRCAQHDRICDTQDIAERAYVIAPLR